MSDTLDFLRDLWSEVPSDMFFLIWTMPDKRSRWFRCNDRGIESAADTIYRLTANDVYMGVAASAQSYGTRQRVSAVESAGIPALWADVDYISDEAHKKRNLPPSLQDARDLLDEAHPPPTILVHSGNGLQAWWLFDKPWMFTSQQDQAAGADLAKRWTDHLRQTARDRGWAVDATHDLARVMRVPGTRNQKNDPPRDVTIEQRNTEATYGVADLRKQMSAPPVEQVDLDLTSSPEAVGFALRPEASPPFKKWEALRKADTSIERTWQRQRRDLGDQSPSGYDMALANFAAMAGWEDQEVVNLLIAHRAEHGDDLKLDRPDYYARTLRKARDAATRVQATDQIDITLHEFDVAGPQEREKQRTALLDWLSPILKVGVVRVERFTTEPAHFRMLTESGWVALGTTSDILSQHKMRAAMMEVTRTRFDRMKGWEWDKVAEAIVRAAIDVDVGPEPTQEGSTWEWLTEYLQQHHPADEPEEHVLIARVPFYKDDRVYIFLSSFRAWLERAANEKLSRSQLATRLRLIGCEPTKHNCTIDGKVTTRSVWQLPEEANP